MQRPTSIAERLLLLEAQMDEVLRRLEAGVGSTGLYLGPAIPENIHNILINAGYNTPEKLREASDEELLALPGIGKSTLTRIRKALQ